MISVLISLDALKDNNRTKLGMLGAALLVGLINALVLAGAVIGADVVTS